MLVLGGVRLVAARQRYASVNSPTPPNGIEQNNLPLFGVARQPLVFLGILEQMILCGPVDKRLCFRSRFFGAFEPVVRFKITVCSSGSPIEINGPQPQKGAKARESA